MVIAASSPGQQLVVPGCDAVECSDVHLEKNEQQNKEESPSPHFHSLTHLLFIPFEPKRRRESSSRTHRVEVLIFVLTVTCQWVLFTPWVVSVVRKAEIPDRTACVCSSAEWRGHAEAGLLPVWQEQVMFVYFYTITDSRQAKQTIIPHRLTHTVVRLSAPLWSALSSTSEVAGNQLVL